jgi:1-acyl-sn-glycerol-3-phosphate acyltransferase
MRRAILGSYTYLEFGLACLAWLPVMKAASIMHADDPVSRVPGQWVRRLGRTTSRLTPLWKFSVEGVPPVDVRSRAYVVVANHESNADPFLMSYLPLDMRFIAKEELFRAPVTGWILKMGGDIPLRRGQKDSVAQMFAECDRTLKHGMSVMVFPEGTRSKDGTLLPFKDGAFQMAIDAGVPILPVAISGTKDCLPKGSAWFGEAKAVAKMLPHIETTGLTRDDVPRIREEARNRIQEAVQELRARA